VTSSIVDGEGVGFNLSYREKEQQIKKNFGEQMMN